MCVAGPPEAAGAAMEAVYPPIAVVIAAALVASAAIAELVIAVCTIAAAALLVLATCIMAELLDELITMAGTTVVSAGETQANVTASTTGCAARDMPAAEETRRAVVNLILGFLVSGNYFMDGVGPLSGGSSTWGKGVGR